MWLVKYLVLGKFVSRVNQQRSWDAAPTTWWEIYKKKTLKPLFCINSHNVPVQKVFFFFRGAYHISRNLM